ncbi:hypothetical protein PH210_12765 [Paenibacillus sp. BSR1-1]|uniref:hypothetical protein n=1 Tax=Paenibacillus sp. BSR1-1 TaxID=3020845 RepID=UPI0025B1A959|nr:hypothetical protein [Paenibacillus sp. BSR1-1]MDN3017064.1 hypothetical protein [Paenibacillus sp. BSR1-1]
MTVKETSTFTHKQLAVQYFNKTWDVLDLNERTIEEEEKMVHLAHSSFWHWTQVENHTPKNLSIGYWQLSRVYATVGNGERAQYYAERCLDVSLENKIEPFYVGYAYEALGRANVLLKQSDLALELVKQAQEYAEQVQNENEKSMLLNDLKTIGF